METVDVVGIENSALCLLETRVSGITVTPFRHSTNGIANYSHALYVAACIFPMATSLSPSKGKSLLVLIEYSYLVWPAIEGYPLVSVSIWITGPRRSAKHQCEYVHGV